MELPSGGGERSTRWQQRKRKRKSGERERKGRGKVWETLSKRKKCATWKRVKERWRELGRWRRSERKEREGRGAYEEAKQVQRMLTGRAMVLHGCRVALRDALLQETSRTSLHMHGTNSPPRPHASHAPCPPALPWPWHFLRPLNSPDPSSGPYQDTGLPRTIVAPSFTSGLLATSLGLPPPPPFPGPPVPRVG